ncbi:DUF748 domain-containing protein [Pontibacter sp. JAM-7]|uniref:DUF748 domain-containing protein n=1 Tax=Pontibacter sp. JAM-7 TaxID=3366581 RepID=UPI003AF93035
MLRWLLALVVLVLLGLHNLPYLIRDQAVQWLRAQGAEDARLTALEVNWLKGDVTVRGLAATAKGKPTLRIDYLKLGLDYDALALKHILLHEISLSGVDIGVRQQPEALWLGPIDLLALQGAEPTEPVSPNTAASAWSFGLKRMQLSDINWRAELPGQTHQLKVNQAEVQDLLLWAPDQATLLQLDGEINGAPIKLSSEALPLPEQKTTRLTIKLSDFPVHSLAAPWVPGLRARVDLDLQIQAGSHLQEQTFTLSQQGKIHLKNLSFTQDQLAVQQQSLAWQGQLSLLWHSGALQQLKTDSTLSVAGLNVSQDQQQLSLDGGSVAAVVEGSLSELQTTVSALSLSALQFNRPGQSYQLAEASLQGLVKLVEGVPRNIQLDAFNLQNLAVAEGAVNPYNITLATAAARGSVDTSDGKLWQVNLPSIELQNAELNRQGSTLVDLQTLTGQGVSVKDNAAVVSVAGAQLKQLQVLGEAHTLSQWQTIELDALQLDQMSRLLIDQVRFSGGTNRLLLSAERQPAEFNWLLTRLQPESAATQAKPQAETKTESEAKPFHVRINRLIVSGDNKLALIDQGVKPPLNTELELQKLELEAFDTASDQATGFALQSRLGRFTQLDANGSLELFSGNYGGNWALDLKALDLPLVSPYFSHYTGYLLRNGQLNISSSGSVAGRKLDGKTDIQLNRIAVQRDKSNRSEAFNKKVTMPLETALMVLQDKDENIHLDVPLNGSLDDPQFGYQTVINKLAGKGLKNAAFGYLTKSLQPFGALITVAQMAMDAAEKGTFIQLQPVQFEPLSSELSSTAEAYMSKLAGMLTERPAMRLNICGEVVAADAEPLRKQLADDNKKASAEALQALLIDQLQTLAVARGDQVKEALSQQQVSVERLFTCYPQVDPAAAGEPLTRLGL